MAVIAAIVFWLWIIGWMSIWGYQMLWRGKNFEFQLYLGVAAGYVGIFIYSAITWGWGPATIFLLGVAYFLWRAWQHRPPRNRKKVLKLIGAKARVIRDKMVAAMPKPRGIAVPA